MPVVLQVRDEPLWYLKRKKLSELPVEGPMARILGILDEEAATFQIVHKLEDATRFASKSDAYKYIDPDLRERVEAIYCDT